MRILALCRAGFEKEVAAELTELAALNELAGYAKTKEKAGYVEFICPSHSELLQLLSSIEFTELVFIRHWLVAHEAVVISNPKDRVSPLLQAMTGLIEALGIGSVSRIEPIHLDTNEGKSLTKLTSGVSFHLRRNAQHLVDAMAQYRAEVFFLDGERAFVGVSHMRNGSPWPAGIPRLRLPRAAPSRATLKLEEAWHHFLPTREWETRLAAGMRSVDLGAAPGGWTWQLVQRSMFVDAVDNGPMDKALMETGQVTHHLLDGFLYKPAKPVDWLVCDIADKPARVASMIARWAVQRWCRESVFNLKLPMKQRYREVQKCSDIISSALADADIPHRLRFKQLYHDREEVTGHLQLF